MIQRIQSLYLFVSAMLSAILPLFFPLWKDIKLMPIYFTTDLAYIILFGLSTIMALVSILLYKKRQNQFVLNRLNIILNFILIGLFVYRSLKLSGEVSVSEKDIAMFVPLVSIVLLVLANKAIKKDEDLVKSVDRLR
jgi:tellurite resistance protein TehA-like permease